MLAELNHFGSLICMCFGIGINYICHKHCLGFEYIAYKTLLDYINKLIFVIYGCYILYWHIAFIAPIEAVERRRLSICVRDIYSMYNNFNISGLVTQLLIRMPL